MNFYAEKYLPCFQKAYTSLPLLHCHPFYWLDDGPAIIRTWRARLVYDLNVALVICYYIFLLGHTAHAYLAPASPIAVKFYLTGATVVHSFGVLYHVFVLTTTNDFVAFMRGYIKMLKDGKIFELNIP